MPENDKNGSEKENFSFLCIQGGQKRQKKKSETFQDTPLACSNSSEASGEVHPFVKRSEESRNRILIFSEEKTLTVDPVFNEQNDES